MLLMIEKPRSTPAERARAALGRAATAGLAALRAAATWPLRVAESRRVMQALAGLSDRDLRDIGLARGDLRDATALPSAADPTGFLAARRQGRRP